MNIIWIEAVEEKIPKNKKLDEEVRRINSDTHVTIPSDNVEYYPQLPVDIQEFKKIGIELNENINLMTELAGQDDEIRIDYNLELEEIISRMKIQEEEFEKKMLRAGEKAVKNVIALA